MRSRLMTKSTAMATIYQTVRLWPFSASPQAASAMLKLKKSQYKDATITASKSIETLASSLLSIQLKSMENEEETKN